MGSNPEARSSLWRRISSDQTSPAVDLFFLTLFGLLAFGQSLHAGFMVDDHLCITSRPELQGWSWSKLEADFSTTIYGDPGLWGYRPLQALFMRLLVNLFGLNAPVFHAANLLLHIGSAFLLWDLTRHLASRRIALMACALFVVNPIGMDQFLPAAAGMNDPLSLFFVALAAAITFRGDGWPSDLCACVAGFLAILAKESGIVFPIILVLAVYVRDQRLPPYRSLFLWLGTACLYVLILARHRVSPFVGPVNVNDIVHFLVVVFPTLLAHYIGLVLLPWKLYNFRSVPSHLPPWWFLAIPLLVLIGILALRKKRAYCFGYAWFLLFLLPKVPLMFQFGLLPDHYAYASTYGLFLILSAVLDEVWQAGHEFVGAATFAALFCIGMISALVHFSLRDSEEKNLRWCLRFEATPATRLHFATWLIRTNRPAEALPILESLWNPAAPDRFVGYPLADALAKSNHFDEARRVLIQLHHPGSSKHI